MNDFTKEELKELSIVLNEYLKEFTSPESTHQLKDKVQSMIDNYEKEKEYNIKLDLGLNHDQAEYLVDKIIMPFLCPEKNR